MADVDVENILREIRERVYAEQETAAQSSASNGRLAAGENGELAPVEYLPRLESYLTTTARAWDRLPPVVSNRSGTTARIELWLKRYLKRATRWYAWEQVNFNAAVHHALIDMVQLLSANAKTIEDLRGQLRAASETRKADLQQREALSKQVATLHGMLAEQSVAIDAERAAAVVLDDRLAAIVNELREGIARVLEEQRVSYKQLALEAGEAAVLEDRARRKTQALLEQLQRRVEQLEKS